MVKYSDIALDRTFAALADPTRRGLLAQLGLRQEISVSELARPFAMSLNSVSKHIRVLERARLVRRRRAGREHVLSFNARPLEEAAAWIATQRAEWTARLAALDALLQAEDRAVAARRRRKKQP